MLKNKKLLFAFSLFFLFLRLISLEFGIALDSVGGHLAEGWFSDIAYHLNWEFNGWMAKDIPYGASWNTGIGKLFFFIHNVFYKVFGVGLFQARLVTFVSGVVLLILLYRWARKYISQEVAIFPVILLVSSPLFYTSLPNAKQDVMHCLFAFISFYLISSAVLIRKDIYYLLAGFMSALSVDISYRGIEIVLAVYIFHLIFLERGTFLKRSSLLLTGSLAAFIYWFVVNVLPIGIDNFIAYHLSSASVDGGPYSMKTLLSEVNRFLYLLSGKGKYIFGVEIFYLVLLSIIFYKNRLQYKSVTKIIISWVLINLVIMTLFEKTTGRIYLLMYYPFIFLISGVGLYKLFNHNKKLAYGILASILLFASILQGTVFSKYIYHTHLKRDYDLKGYYGKLRVSVDINKNIIGTTNHWYAFTDTQYYGGQFYLSRVMSILNELKPADEYKNDYERANALLKVFKKRKIEYVIADEYFKPTIVKYFSDNKLPAKNFLLVNTITDMFLGKGNESKIPPYRTEIYKVVSYEP